MPHFFFFLNFIYPAPTPLPSGTHHTVVYVYELCIYVLWLLSFFHQFCYTSSVLIYSLVIIFFYKLSIYFLSCIFFFHLICFLQLNAYQLHLQKYVWLVQFLASWHRAILALPLSAWSGCLRVYTQEDIIVCTGVLLSRLVCALSSLIAWSSMETLVKSGTSSYIHTLNNYKVSV